MLLLLLLLSLGRLLDLARPPPDADERPLSPTTSDDETNPPTTSDDEMNPPPRRSASSARWTLAARCSPTPPPDPVHVVVGAPDDVVVVTMGGVAAALVVVVVDVEIDDDAGPPPPLPRSRWRHLVNRLALLVLEEEEGWESSFDDAAEE